MSKVLILFFSLALAGCGGGGSAGGSGTSSSSIGISKNGFKQVTSNYLLTTCPVSAGVSTNGWYKCLLGTSFVGYVDLFNKKYCEIAIGNDGAFHYITDTEYLSTAKSEIYGKNNLSSGAYSLINNGDTLGPYLIASLSSNFSSASQFSDFSVNFAIYSNRFYLYLNNQLSYPSEIIFYQKSGTFTINKTRTCYINSLD